MKKKGFTLIELIIVMALLSIISIGIFNFYSVELNIYSDQSYLSDIKNDERNARNYISQDIRGTDAKNFLEIANGSEVYVNNIMFVNDTVTSNNIAATLTNRSADLQDIDNSNLKMFLQKQNNTAVIYALQNHELKRISYTVNYSYTFDETTAGTQINDSDNDFNDTTIKNDTNLGTKEIVQKYLPYIRDLSTLENAGNIIDDIFKSDTGGVITMVYHNTASAAIFYSKILTVGSTTYTDPIESTVASKVNDFTTTNVGAVANASINSATNNQPTYGVNISFIKKDATMENIDITESEINYGGDSYETN